MELYSQFTLVSVTDVFRRNVIATYQKEKNTSIQHKNIPLSKLTILFDLLCLVCALLKFCPIQGKQSKQMK